MQSDIYAHKRTIKRTKTGGVIIVPIEKIKEDIVNIINENKNLNINDEYIEEIIQSIDPIKAQSINPEALVLSSTVFKNNKIDLKLLNNNIKTYKNNTGKNVDKVDIIRYAKFLMLLSDINN
jgi:hypothetical protein